MSAHPSVDDLDLVPPAEQPHAAHTAYPDQVRDTIWENATDKDVVLDLHVGTTPIYGDERNRPKLSREQRTGLRQFVIPAKSKRSIPSEFDQAIQQTHCQHPDCSGRKAFCRDRSHPAQIVGGIGPQLKNLTTRVRPVLAPALDALRAEKAEAHERAARAKVEAQLATEKASAAESELDTLRRQLAERDTKIAEMAAAQAADARPKAAKNPAPTQQPITATKD